MIRTSLKREFDQWDNYVVGLSPSHTDPRRVLYVMHVGEWMTFSEAWRRGEEDRVYRLKRGGHSPFSDYPSTVRMNGDIVVRSDDGIHYVYVGGVHEEDWDTYVVGGRNVGAKRDIYIVGDTHGSQYFWDKGLVFTERMFRRYWKGYPNMRGHRVLYGNKARDILGELDLL